MGENQQSAEPQVLGQSEVHRLFVQNQRRVFGHILTLLPRVADAEEVFQETCVIILSKAGQFTAGTDFVRWACQIAQYEVYNFRRRRQHERLHFNAALLDTLAAKRLEKSDLLDLSLDVMRQCVEHLPVSDKQLIRDRYGRNITSRALAIELGRPENAVYKSLLRIRRGLRECVERSLLRQGEKRASDSISDNPGASSAAGTEDRP